jgi:formate hydrogenlyase transcriptional activator
MRAEAELRRSEIELRQTLDFAPQLIAVFGPRRERLFINRIALDYFGLSLDEWRTTAHGLLGHPDDTKRVQAQWDRAMSSGSAFEMEVRMRKGDGSYRWFLNRWNPVLDEEGHILRWNISCTDIEDRKQAEERLQQENVALREEIDSASMFEEIVGSSEALQRVLVQVAKVARTDSTVLILGETGTGKELIARAIHKQSSRSTKAFIRVNCAAIPSSLIASELFGHEKGSFTGAVQRRLGRFESANGGTILLDEIGELPVETQILLLRVLQEREFERVGSSHPIPVDVRVLAATNRDVQAAVEEGKFRRDLFYRLNVFPIQIPPLRERVDDIPLLVEYLVARYANKAGKKIKNIRKKTLKLFQSYEWPGNIRELQNVVERAVILCDGETFAVDETWLRHEPIKMNEPTISFDGMLAERRKDFVHNEKGIIEAALKACHGRVSGPSGAAAKLGIPHQTLASKIKALRINKYQFKTS